ncbi:MAG: phage tail assembly chaperone [Hyphomonadaceae bacterium]
MTESTPWRAMLAAALQLGITPHQFWRLSLPEWRVLIAPLGADMLPRAAFEALTHRFPDRSK